MLKDFNEWLKKEKDQICLTLLAAIIPVILSAIFIKAGETDSVVPFNPNNYPNNELVNSEVNKSSESDLKIFIKRFTISERQNYAAQSLFIFFSLFILLHNKKIIYDYLENGQSIKTYLIRKCHVKIKDENTIIEKYNIIQDTTKYFFRVWILVWMMWLALYLGLFMFTIIDINKASSIISIPISQLFYRQVFDFMTSSTVFIIYLVLTNVTINIRHHKNYDESIWWGILGWILCFTIFIICLCAEFTYKDSENARIITTTLLSVISAISFLLVLGKLNSLYLQIPQGFLIILYFYGIFQCYHAFPLILEKNIIVYLNFLIPYITLIGKVVLMLTLCWITYNKRFIYYIIHQTVLVEETPQLLKELNRK